MGVRYNNYALIEAVLPAEARRPKVCLLGGLFSILEAIVLIGERRL